MNFRDFLFEAEKPVKVWIGDNTAEDFPDENRYRQMEVALSSSGKYFFREEKPRFKKKLQWTNWEELKGDQEKNIKGKYFYIRGNKLEEFPVNNKYKLPS